MREKVRRLITLGLRGSLYIQPNRAPPQMEFNGSIRGQQRREKVVVIMGATGSGKSRLSIHIARRFNGEVINSDKIQLYKGLDILTNKIPMHDQLGVTHHLLGELDSVATQLTAAEFRSYASAAISSVTARRKISVIAGGSNSFIYALLSEKFDPSSDSDVFSGSESVCTELRYNCCFLWIHVALPVLKEYLFKRVDEMIGSGLVDELAEFYNSMIDNVEPNTGLRKAIGVPEFENYFRCADEGNDKVRKDAYEEAVRNTKENTYNLAKRQMEKIERLKAAGWNINRLDGTDSFRVMMEGCHSWSDIWEKQVVAPSVNIVKQFLDEE